MSFRSTNFITLHGLIYIPYARHYKPRLVYFFILFPKTIYVLYPLALCMACIQKRPMMARVRYLKFFVIIPLFENRKVSLTQSDDAYLCRGCNFLIFCMRTKSSLSLHEEFKTSLPPKINYSTLTWFCLI